MASPKWGSSEGVERLGSRGSSPGITPANKRSRTLIDTDDDDDYLLRQQRSTPRRRLVAYEDPFEDQDTAPILGLQRTSPPFPGLFGPAKDPPSVLPSLGYSGLQTPSFLSNPLEQPTRASPSIIICWACKGPHSPTCHPPPSSYCMPPWIMP
jgi:hypothetical protein